MKLGHAFLAIAAVVLLASAARADSIPASSYDINGNLTIPGHGTFLETIYFSFTLDYFTIPSYQDGPVYGLDTQIVSPILVASSGQLGFFGSNAGGFGPGGGGPGPWAGYLGFFNAGGDEIDLDMNNVDISFAPIDAVGVAGPPTRADSVCTRANRLLAWRTFSCIRDSSDFPRSIRHSAVYGHGHPRRPAHEHPRSRRRFY